MLSMYRRCQVSQSVCSFGTWTGRFLEGADVAGAGRALKGGLLRLLEGADALAFSL